MLLRAIPVAVLLLGSCGVRDEGLIELRLGHVAQPGSLTHETSLEFARNANERLAGRAWVTVFGSSQLGHDASLLLRLRLGTVDFAVPSTIMSSVVDAFGLFEMPYLIRDRDHLVRIREEIFWPELEPLTREKGYRIVALWENGFRHVTNNVRPITRPEDLAGIKLRTPRGRWRIRLFQSYGASPAPMSLGEVFVALQTGVIDGQENPLSQTHSSKFHEVQKFLSITNHVYSPGYLTVGKDRWENLRPDVRSELEQAARETQVWVKETGERLDRELLADLRTSGIEINVADRESFVAASTGIYEEFAEAIPGAEKWIEKALLLADSPEGP